MKKSGLILLLLVFTVIILLGVGCKQQVSEETTATEITAAETTAAATAGEKEYLPTTPDITGMRIDGATIGVTYPTFEVAFWSDSLTALKQVIGDAGGKVVEFDPKFDAFKQAQAIDNFIATGVKGVILCTLDPKALTGSIDKLNAANIPIIFQQAACTTDESKVLCGVVSSLPYEDGQNTAKELVKVMGDKGNIVMVNYTRDWGTSQRYYGAREWLQVNAPNVVVVASEEWGGIEAPSRVTAEKQMDNFILQFGDKIDGAIAVSDDCALGLIASIDKHKLQDKIKVVSYDASPEGIEAMKKGEPLYSTTIMYPKLSSEWAAKLMIQYLVKGILPPAKVIQFTSGILTKEDAIKGITVDSTITDKTAWKSSFANLYPKGQI